MGILKGKKWRLVFSFSWPCHVSSSFWSNASKLPFESVSCQLTKETGRRLSSWDKGRSLCPIPQFSQIQTARLLQNSDIGTTRGADATKSPRMLFCTNKELSKVFGSHPVPIYYFFTVQSFTMFCSFCNLDFFSLIANQSFSAHLLHNVFLHSFL